MEGLGLITLAIEDILQLDELWAPVKQPAAVASFVNHATHIEKDSRLAARLSTFFTKAAAKWTDLRKKTLGKSVEPNTGA